MSQKTSAQAELARYVNPQSPLGPFAADRIKHDEVAAQLFDPHNTSFNKLLSRDIDIIVGRRGSGKTALLNCYRYRRAVPRVLPIPSINNTDLADYDIVLTISSHIIFERMQALVVGSNGVFRPIESVVDEWQRLIGDLILSELVRIADKSLSAVKPLIEYLGGPEAANRLQALELVWGKPFWKSGKTGPASITQEQAFDAGEVYLKGVTQKFVLLFDSMDEYMIGERVVDRTVGALLRYVRDFNSNRDRFKIKLKSPFRNISGD